MTTLYSFSTDGDEMFLLQYILCCLDTSSRFAISFSVTVEIRLFISG